MNIVVIVRYYPTRAETFIRRQIERLSASVMCEKFFPDRYQDFGLTTEVHEIGDGGSLFGWYRRLRGALSLYSDLWSPSQRRAAKEVLQRLQPDAVLAHYGPNAIKAASTCHALGIPLFVHFNGYDASSLLRDPWYRSAIVKVLDQAAGIVAVSDAMGDEIRKLVVDDERLAVIPYGVDVHSFPVRNGGASDHCVFLMVGRLVDKKAPLVSIRAFEACADAAPESELRIIGFGPLEHQVKSYVESSRHRERIAFLGPRDFDQVREELLRADVFVQHSVTAENGDTEGWPNSIAEGAACGLPIVSTRHAGIPMQVRHGETGYLVEEGDVDGMAQGMTRLALDRVVRARMGLAGRKYIEEVGDIDACVARLGSFIESGLKM